MNAWKKLKRILNEEKEITEAKLKDKVFINHMITHKNFREYVNLLVDIGYIGHWRQYINKYNSFNAPYYKLIKKIPEKLTISDAKKMKHMPWLEWFKYSE